MAIVYNHKRNDTGEIFYIGIGLSDKRAYSTKGRNKHWRHIVNKVGYSIEITHLNICREEAVVIEQYLITFYGRADKKLGNLVNMTDGGDGLLNPSEECLRANRQRGRDLWQNQEIRKRLTEKANLQMQDAAFKEKFQAGRDRKSHEEEFIAKRRASSKRIMNSPGHLDKMMAGLKKKWEDPSFREKVTERAKSQFDDLEFKERMRAVSKEKWKDADYIKMQVEKGRKLWENTDFRAKKTALARQQFANPEFRKLIDAGIKRGSESPEAVKLIVIATGEVIGSFIDAEKIIGKTRATIRAWAKKRHIVMYYNEHLKSTKNE